MLVHSVSVARGVPPTLSSSRRRRNSLTR
jgi:hypothetical protein